MIVDTGKKYVANRIAGTAATQIVHIAIGTGATAPAAGDTALGTEVARLRVNNITINQNVGEIIYNITFPAGTGSGKITEAGLFDASANGIMFARFNFTAINKSANTALNINYTLSLI